MRHKLIENILVSVYSKCNTINVTIDKENAKTKKRVVMFLKILSIPKIKLDKIMILYF